MECKRPGHFSLSNSIAIDIDSNTPQVRQQQRHIGIGAIQRTRRTTKPRKSVIDIQKFAGEDRESVVERLENWNRAVLANGWRSEDEKVTFPLYLTGRASQHFRHLQGEIKESITDLNNEYENHFNSPSRRIQAKYMIGERSQKPTASVAEFLKKFPG